jgi:hypothetical protein
MNWCCRVDEIVSRLRRSGRVAYDSQRLRAGLNCVAPLALESYVRVSMRAANGTGLKTRRYKETERV